MNHYLYDGTFEGFLTVVEAVAAQSDTVAAISVSEPEQLDLFTSVLTLPTDPNRAQKFFQKLAARLSMSTLTDMMYCFCSEETGIEMVLLQFIRMVLAEGEPVTSNFKDPIVFKIRRLSDQVAHEIQRFHGFIRFRKLPDGLYYAAIEPDYNIVRFLAPHFRGRFADQPWLIHDLKRNSGIYYDCRQCSFLPAVAVLPEIAQASVPGGAGMTMDVFAASEFGYQELWNEYFREIAIRERKNPRAQRQRMPERYWRHLVERVKE